jgi:hypothetical protein
MAIITIILTPQSYYETILLPEKDNDDSMLETTKISTILKQCDLVSSGS